MKSIEVHNDTSRYHNGCVEVMNFIYDEIDRSENLNQIENNAEIVLINGEGSMHDNQPRARSLMELIRKSVSRGKNVMLVNSVFQRMELNENERRALAQCYVSVREINSKRYLEEKFGIDANINLDLSYYRVPENLSQKNVSKSLVVGQKFWRDKQNYRENDETLHRINIFEQSWSEVINEIRQAEVFVTGRHHEMYASCIAETPFIVTEGNTWKNGGLIETAKRDIPDLNIQVLDGHATDDEIQTAIDNIDVDAYKQLFEWMKNYKRFSIDDCIRNW